MILSSKSSVNSQPYSRDIGAGTKCSNYQLNDWQRRFCRRGRFHGLFENDARITSGYDILNASLRFACSHFLVPGTARASSSFHLVKQKFGSGSSLSPVCRGSVGSVICLWLFVSLLWRQAWARLLSQRRGYQIWMWVLVRWCEIWTNEAKRCVVLDHHITTGNNDGLFSSKLVLILENNLS